MPTSRISQRRLFSYTLEIGRILCTYGRVLVSTSRYEIKLLQWRDRVPRIQELVREAMYLLGLRVSNIQMSRQQNKS